MHGFQMFEERVGAKLTASTSLRAIDWGKLLEILIPLIAGCFLSPTPNGLRRRLFRFSNVVAAVKREMGCTYDEARQVVGHLYDVADEATDAEMQEFIDDCKCCK